MIKKEDVYRIGRIGKPHGVNGEVSFLFDDDIFLDDDAEYLLLDIDGILVPFFIDVCRLRNPTTALITFVNVHSQERARKLTGREVYFPRHTSPDDEAPVSLYQLVGFSVINDADGKVIGTLHAVDYSTINPLFRVLDKEGDIILLPAAEDLITKLDISNGKITMSLPDGILDLNKKKD